MPAPPFLTLAEWGGRVNTIGRMMTVPAADLWVHHSVTNENIGVHPTEDAIADFLELDALGVGGGISYSHAIHPNGTIGEGQGTRQGAHTGGTLGCGGSPWGWNPCSFGVCFVGDFHPRPGVVADELTDAAVSSFRWLREKLIVDGALVPGVYPSGGHRDASGNSTACPGDNIVKRLDDLRAPYAPTPPGDDDMAKLLHSVDQDRWFLHDRGVFPIDADMREALKAAGVPVHPDVLQIEIDRVASAYPAPAPAAGGGVTAAQVEQIVTRALKALRLQTA